METLYPQSKPRVPGPDPDAHPAAEIAAEPVTGHGSPERRRVDCVGEAA